MGRRLSSQIMQQHCLPSLSDKLQRAQAIRGGGRLGRSTLPRPFLLIIDFDLQPESHIFSLSGHPKGEAIKLPANPDQLWPTPPLRAKGTQYPWDPAGLNFPGTGKMMLSQKHRHRRLLNQCECEVLRKLNEQAERNCCEQETSKLMRLE